MPTIRAEVPEEASTKAIIKDLDIVDELKEAATMCIASYQQRLASWHNRRVNSLTFKARELVLRRVFENKSNPADGKFQPNWEGPYTVVLVGTTGSYCDAPFPERPLTTCQPAEYSWKSGNPTPLMKIG